MKTVSLFRRFFEPLEQGGHSDREKTILHSHFSLSSLDLRRSAPDLDQTGLADGRKDHLDMDWSLDQTRNLANFKLHLSVAW